MWDRARRRGRKTNCPELAGQRMDLVIMATAGRFLGTEHVAAEKQMLVWSVGL